MISEQGKVGYVINATEDKEGSVWSKEAEIPTEKQPACAVLSPGMTSPSHNMSMSFLCAQEVFPAQTRRKRSCFADTCGTEVI